MIEKHAWYRHAGANALLFNCRVAEAQRGRADSALHVGGTSATFAGQLVLLGRAGIAGTHRSVPSVTAPTSPGLLCDV